MTSGTTNLRGLYLRGCVQIVGVLAVVAGAIGWLTGWRHGQSLVILGLAVYVASLFTRDISVHRTLGAIEALHSRRSSGEEALAHAADAVRHYRKLAAKRPGERRRLDQMLEAQWHLLNKLEKHEDALPVAREAVESCRLGEAADADYDERLSTTLHNLAVTLERLEHTDEMPPVLDEAIAARRRIIARHERVLAISLSNLVIMLRGRREWHSAMTAAEEAAAIRRRLAEADPDQHEAAADSARSLTGLLDRLDRPADALEAAREWVGHERAVTSVRADRAPELATALVALGSLLVKANSPDDAKTHWRESLEIRRRMAAEDVAHRLTLAEECSTIGYDLGASAEYEEALTVLREGLDVRRALADSDTTHTDGLARELTHSARCARSYREPELARQLAAEGLAVCREHPDSTTRHALLRALQELSAAHQDLGEFEPAVALGQEALTLLEELIADDVGYLGAMVTELEQHAFLLHRVGRPEDARRTEMRGVEIWERHNPDADQ